MTALSPPRPQRPGGLLATVMVAVLWFGGCPRHLPVATRPYDAPSAAELMGLLRAHQKAVTTMNARVRATSWLGGDRVRATVMMLVDRTGRLRFEAEVSLQGTVAVLATDGRQFSFLDVSHNELRQGPACPANVASLIRIPLGPNDVAAILLGDVDLAMSPADSTDATVDWDAARAADVLVLHRGDGWLRVLFQRANGGPASRPDRIVGAVATDEAGRSRWHVAFEDLTEVRLGPDREGAARGTATVPGTIRFAEGNNSFDDGVEIKVKDRALNEALSASAFTLDAPEHAKLIAVGCPPSAAAL